MKPIDESMGGGTGSAGRAGDKAPRAIDQPPPFLGRWGRIYWLVAGLLAAEVLVFWLLGRWAA